ncbi:type II toxin-antitoxin system HicA family toxin [Marinobacter maritimus]|uniref:type II toxin-antitoxin system HicA family toxin n=1 Tax=Marinobacter maritimus TaxID=277961 RepID=UPI0011A271AB|tara:strand:- start:1425 stop:1691 length:267 start_codon:yes stop_codon:yes gene_type:complete
MVNKEKFAAKLLRKPTPRDIAWAELRGFLLSLGFEEQQGSGSRVRFYLQPEPDARGLMIRLHKPHPKKVCGPLMVRDVVRVLKAWGLL